MILILVYFEKYAYKRDTKQC